MRSYMLEHCQRRNDKSKMQENNSKTVRVDQLEDLNSGVPEETNRVIVVWSLSAKPIWVRHDC